MDERQVVSVEILRSLLRIGERVLEDLRIKVKFDTGIDKENLVSSPRKVVLIEK